MSRYRPAKPQISRRSADILLREQQRDTVRRMLAAGGVISGVGSTRTITLPSGGFGTFPAAMVAAVAAERDVLDV